MGSRGLVVLKGPSHLLSKSGSKVLIRNCSTTTTNNTNGSNGSSSSSPSSLQPPDVSRLAETARISLTPHEVQQYAPKIRQVIDWFGQLQAVDLTSIEPAIRADTEGDNLREDIPETFQNREAMIAAVPSFEEPYIKVPKILNKE